MLKGYRFRLNPNGAQEVLFRKTAGSCRFVYNSALFHRQEHYRETGKSLWTAGQAGRLVALKKEPATSWLSEVPSQCLQQSLIDLDRAYENFFNDLAKYKVKAIRAKAVRRPKPHKKGKSADSFRFPQSTQFVLEPKRVKLPKAGWVKFSASQKIQGKPKSITVSRDGENWFMSVLCEVFAADVPFAPAGEAIGIDLNVEEGAAVALSDGRCFETAKTSKREYRHLAKLKRTLSRRKKGSQNYKKAVAKLAKFERHRANRRKDAIHKATTHLAKNHSVIVIEDLKVKSMTRSAKGTVENPGKNVKAKSGLNRVLLDRAPGFFRQCLTYKCGWTGAELRKVNPAYTSQKCSCCGHTSKANRTSTSLFQCEKCGHTESAHTNAAKNIKVDGLIKPQRSVDEVVNPGVEPGCLGEAETHRGAAA